MSEVKAQPRRATRGVDVGKVRIGGGAPVVVQSMTNTDTADIAATVKQVAELWRAGSELVRVTVNNPESAAAVPRIRDKLAMMNVPVPIVGDFHYNGDRLLAAEPACAEALAKYRINPGNVGFGKKRDTQFAAIVEKAIEYGKPVRIGVNWGSLDQSLAGLAGGIHALFVSYVTAGETFNITVPLTVVLMSVLGGSRHWAGPMLGGILITLLLHAFTAGESALIGKVIIGLVLAGAVLIMPRGILGTWQLRQHKRLIQRTQDLSGDVHASEHTSEDSLVIERPLSRPADSPDRQKVLEVRGLSKHFSGIRALNQVDLDLYRGEILGLLGPNGSGKSTFINVVTGHYRPTSGSVLLRGQSCAGWAAHRIRRQGLSRTYQIPRPFNGLTVLQNVMVLSD